jgi:hypothetical protein
VFVHPVGYIGYVVHSDASEAQMLIHYFSCFGGTGKDLRKSALGPLHLSCVFASGGIYGPHNAFDVSKA